jgi:hypothetical protein
MYNGIWFHCSKIFMVCFHLPAKIMQGPVNWVLFCPTLNGEIKFLFHPESLLTLAQLLHDLVYFIYRMRINFLIVPAILMFKVAGAQNGSASITPAGTVSIPVSAASSTPVSPPVAPAVSSPEPASPAGTETSYLDYKSVYETATVEEEVVMASERFGLTTSQQDMWLKAAGDRRQSEKQFRDKIESKTDFDKSGAYMGLRSSLNTFHETIIAYLTPAQKQALETDRLILQEKQQRVAKLPPPPPPAPTVTAAPVDSAAIKETEKNKVKGKKARKKKKPAGS